MKAVLRYHSKLKLQGRYIVEISIHEVAFSGRYPYGVKYGLICIDEQTGSKILMDNHHPKGPHVHLDHVELTYAFSSEEQLITDFKKLAWERMGIKL